MTAEQVITAAKNDARIWQAAARNRLDDPPPPEELDRERVNALGCDGATVAAAVLSVTGWAPTPLGDDLHPSGEPLVSYDAIFRHFRHRHSDGCGISLGAKPGVVLVAVCGTTAGWTDWLKDVAVERVTAQHPDGSGPIATYRELGHFSTVNWQPPPHAVRSSGVAVGDAALNAAAEAMRPRRVGAAERGWVVWAVPVGDRPLAFPAKRTLGHGVEVLGTGIVPLHAVRGDGWRLSHSGVPLVEPMPSWLLAELGGRWGKPS
ncbi:MAG: hypothetical protein WKF73_12250 [Nocardioidaceae bacterium]